MTDQKPTRITCFHPTAVAAVLLSASAVAQTDVPTIEDEIVVTASRVPQARLSVGSAIDILNTQYLIDRQQPFLSDLLRDLPGLAVNQSGPAGAFTQVRMRGSEANHTLVLIDGIEAGDPFNGGELEFAHLLTGGLARVEVLRGPQSALWGSEAIGGVINVVTGPPRDVTGAWGDAWAEGGSFGTARGILQGGTSGPWGSTRASLSYSDIRGISASTVQPERDGYDNVTASAFSDFAVSEDLTLSFAGRYVSATAEQDSQDFTFGSPTQGLVIDSDSERESERWYGRAAADLATLDGQWMHRVSAGVTDSSNDSLSGGGVTFGSDGRKWDVEYQTDVAFSAAGDVAHSVSALLEYEDLVYAYSDARGGPENQRQSAHQWSAALEYRAAIAEQVFLSAALRRDDPNRFTSETTYRATAAWAIAGTGVKLRASYGTGVAQPNFFELFGFNPNFFVGNPDLQPEKSEGWDIGADYAFADGLGLASITYFDANLKNEIATDFSVFPFTVINRAGTSTRDGLELAVSVDALEELSLAASYTYTDAKDDFGVQEVRRPKHMGSLNVAYRFARATVDVGLNYNGTMQDNEFIFATPETLVTLDDYILGTLSASYRLTDRIEVTARAENLFDETYQDVFGFAAPGIGVYAGVRIRLGQE